MEGECWVQYVLKIDKMLWAETIQWPTRQMWNKFMNQEEHICSSIEGPAP